MACLNEFTKILFTILIGLSLVGMVSAADFVPSGNISGKDIYGMKNMTYVKATTIYQNGVQVLDTSSTINNANHSTYSDYATSWAGATAISDLYYKITSDWLNITNRPTTLSQFTDNLGNRGYNSLSNFTDNLGNRGYNDLNNFSNSPGYFKEGDNLNYKFLVDWLNITNRYTQLSQFVDDLGNRGYTSLSNFTDNLGNRGYNSLSNFTDNLGNRGYNDLNNFSNSPGYFKQGDNLNYYSLSDCNNITGSAGSLCINQTLAANAYADSKLVTTFYNVSAMSVVIGTPAGAISNIQKYDGISYNVSEVNSDIDFRMNFSGITEINQVVFRYKTDASESHTSTISIWDWSTSSWESYITIGASPDWNIITLAVFDSTEHISGGLVRVRFYSNNVGALAHVHYFDWVTLSNGPSTPSSSETDPLSVHTSGTVPLTGNWNAGLWNITASWFLGLVSWNNIRDFPAACPAGDFVTTIGGNLTCATPAGGGTITGIDTTKSDGYLTGGSDTGNVSLIVSTARIIQAIVNQSTALNYGILSYWQNITGRPTKLSEFSNDLYADNWSADKPSYLTSSSAGSTYMTKLVNDTMPKLGGSLDTNGFGINVTSGQKICYDGATCAHYTYFNGTHTVET